MTISSKITKPSTRFWKVVRAVDFTASTGIIAAGLYLTSRSIMRGAPLIDTVVDLGIAAGGGYFTFDAIRPKKKTTPKAGTSLRHK